MVIEFNSSDEELDKNNAYSIHTSSSIVKKQVLSERMVHILGSVYTPSNIARFLTSWAINKSDDKILDVGVGEGVFVFEAYNRLLELGSAKFNAQEQIFGAELDVPTYQRFTEATRRIDINFPNLKNANFFDVDFPVIDAIVGNPPYVRRSYIEDVDKIRQSVIAKNKLIETLNMTRLTDLYIYFLLHALPMLKPGGKLAVITADPWLNAGYGIEFKRYLQQHFRIEKLISPDNRVFEDAQVKPVLILAIKKDHVELDEDISFIRVKNGFSGDEWSRLLLTEESGNNISCSKVRGSGLQAFTPWGIHFKAPEVCEELESHRLMTRMVNVAETRIGLQTLAKGFFVLTSEQVKAASIEQEFLEPLAQSMRYINKPVIDFDTKALFSLFYCASSKDELENTNALGYILKGELDHVEVRGKNIQVIGYHNKERIKRSSRKLWYDLKSSIERRGRAPILIPRLIYHNFKVIWNKAGFVPGELFIEFLPLSDVEVEVCLAILNSSVSEIMLRTYAQIYGGGTYNIAPGRIKNIPILNPMCLTDQEKDALKKSYLYYLGSNTQDRSLIDEVVYSILGFSVLKQQRMKRVLDDLLLLATSSKIIKQNL